MAKREVKTENGPLEHSLPCPFCGGVAIMRQTPGNRFFVHCVATESCGASINFGTREQAIIRWQRRNPTKSTVQEGK